MLTFRPTSKAVRVSRERQLVADMTQAYDALGPLAREAVRLSPIEITVGDMMLAWRQANQHLMMAEEAYSLTDPKIDASVAAFVRDAIKRKMGKPAEAFVICGSPSTSSARLSRLRLSGRV